MLPATNSWLGLPQNGEGLSPSHAKTENPETADSGYAFEMRAAVALHAVTQAAIEELKRSGDEFSQAAPLNQPIVSAKRFFTWRKNSKIKTPSIVTGAEESLAALKSLKGKAQFSFINFDKGEVAFWYQDETLVACLLTKK